MKFEKQQLVQIIREELGQITNEAGKYAEDSYKDVDTSETIHDAAFDSLVLGHGIGADLRDRLGRIDRDSAEELQAIYVGLMKAAHSAREFIEQNAGALQEVSSEKQRRWACAQTGDDFKGDKKLTDKEAKEMCTSPIEERDRARKSTGQYQDMRIKAKEMLWAYFDEELGAMDARASKRVGNKPSDNLVDEVFSIIVDSVPAEVPDNVKRARKDAEEKRKFADIEKMGIYNLENPNIPVKTMKPLKPQPKKKQSLGQRFAWSGLEENKMKLTSETLKQIIKEELGYGNRDDNDPMDIEDAPERTALRVFDEAIESIDADALKNLTAAISSLALNHGYTIDDVVDVLEANENSGVSVAMKDDEIIATRKGDEIIRKDDEIETTRELEECGYPEEEEEEEPKRYFEI